MLLTFNCYVSEKTEGLRKLLTTESHITTTRNENYGRLSPPPPDDDDDDDDVEIKEEHEELTSDQMKEALQRTAYDAVLSNDTKEWSLVSVDGHNTEEPEL